MFLDSDSFVSTCTRWNIDSFTRKEFFSKSNNNFTCCANVAYIDTFSSDYDLSIRSNITNESSEYFRKNVNFYSAQIPNEFVHYFQNEYNIVFHSIIPNDTDKDRVRIALRTLNGFTQGFINGDMEDVNITDRYLTANNLTVPAAMATIGMVNY